MPTRELKATPRDFEHPKPKMPKLTAPKRMVGLIKVAPRRYQAVITDKDGTAKLIALHAPNSLARALCEAEEFLTQEFLELKRGR